LGDDAQNSNQSDGDQHRAETTTGDIPSSKPIHRGGDYQNDDQLDSIGDACDSERVGDTGGLKKVCGIRVELIISSYCKLIEETDQGKTEYLLTGQCPGTDNGSSLAVISSKVV
jgi:hypothetical protein